MTKATDSPRITIRSSLDRSRRLIARCARCLTARAKRRRLALAAVVLIALVLAAAASRLRETPKLEPAFESIVDHGAGPVKVFALADVDGVMHTTDEWSGRQAIVLLFFKLDSAGSTFPGSVMVKLASEFESTGGLVSRCMLRSCGYRGSGDASRPESRLLAPDPA